ncbi:MAG: nucleotide exchange factor GrpE [Synergistaceae bacterium]|nr:nucleotide exchange factor GrpE [Synergistaceae bacterium]
MDDEKLEKSEKTEETDNEVAAEVEEKEKEESEIESLQRQLKTVTADFYNFRQRAAKERQEIRQRSKEEIIAAILPVLDNLDRALTASSQDPQGIIKGVEMVQRQFVAVLEELGVSVIKTEGESFDPQFHDASGTQDVDNPELDGKIIAENLKGYRTKDRVIRPSQVIVGKVKEIE